MSAERAVDETPAYDYAAVDLEGFSNQVHFVNLPWRGLTRVARVSRRGAAKHGVGNWKKGRPQSLWVNRALAHLARWLMGWRDEDHLSCAVFNLLIALEQECTHPAHNRRLLKSEADAIAVSDVWEAQEDDLTWQMATVTETAIDELT